MIYLYLFLATCVGAVIGAVAMSMCAMASDNRDVVRYKSALWEIIWGMRLTDTYHIGVKDILDKHGIEIPKSEVFFK